MDIKSIGLEYSLRSNGNSVRVVCMPLIGFGTGGNGKTRLQVGVGGFAEPEQGTLSMSGPIATLNVAHHLITPSASGPLIGAFVGISAHSGRSDGGASTSGVIGQAGVNVAHVSGTQVVGVKLDVGLPIARGGTRPPETLLSAGATAYLSFGF